jgi:hydroxymethylbilane synthase
MSPPLRIGTRGSPLALAQTDDIVRRLMAAHAELGEAGRLEVVAIKTSGDLVQDRTLAEIGGKGLFTKEIDQALLAGHIDLAVHSMKDVPTRLPAGLRLPCIAERADPRDALIYPSAGRLADLPAGAVIGTASLRRAAQVRLRRPDLKVVPLRGNVGTRLAKLEAGAVDATLLAMAGLARLGLEDCGATPLSTDEMLPAVAQGAIGVTCRAGDTAAMAWLEPLDHLPSHLCVAAERAFLAVLDGSCRTPIGGLAVVAGDALILTGMIIAPDGSACHEARMSGTAAEAEAVGRAVGEDLRRRAAPGFFGGPP